jgi:hypothetical protein
VTQLGRRDRETRLTFLQTNGKTFEEIDLLFACDSVRDRVLTDQTIHDQKADFTSDIEEVA